MLSLIIPLFFVLGLTLFNSIIFNKKFEYVLPIAIVESILIVYIWGFFDLRLGMAFCAFIVLVCLPYLFFHRKDYSIKETFFTNLFWIFLLIYFAVFSLNIGKHFLRWDEFSHWGMMIKEMLRLDQYYFVDESVLVYHKEYPPLTTIFQYIWCRLCNEYKERHLYNAKVILSLSFLFPIYAEFIDKYWTSKNIFSKIIYFLLSTVLLMLIPLVVDVGEAALYRTIYTEYVLILMFLYGMISLIDDEEDRLWFVYRNTLLLTSILLVKQSGIFFFAILIMIYFCKCINNKKILRLEPLFFIGIPIFFWYLWEYISKKNIVSGSIQFAFSKFGIQNLLNVINGKGESYQYETIDSFFSALLNNNLLTGTFKFSYIAVIFLLIGMIGINYCMEKNRKSKANIIIWGIGTITSLIMYIFMMLILYLFCFSISESLSLACYERYMNTIVCPLVMLQVIILLGAMCRKYQKNIITICISSVLIMIMFIIPNESLKEELVPGIFCENIQDIFISDIRYINENTPMNCSILLVEPGDNGAVRNIMAYGCAPRRIKSHSSVSFDMDSSLSDCKNDILENDYLFVREIDESYISIFSVVFDNVEELNRSTLYRIFKEDETSSNILLERIED